jgi:hypothetical protein
MTEDQKNVLVGVTDSVIGGLKQQPLLFGVLLLNAFGISAALYFLLRFGEANATRFDMILQRCLPPT